VLISLLLLYVSHKCDFTLDSLCSVYSAAVLNFLFILSVHFLAQFNNKYINYNFLVQISRYFFILNVTFLLFYCTFFLFLISHIKNNGHCKQETRTTLRTTESGRPGYEKWTFLNSIRPHSRSRSTVPESSGISGLRSMYSKTFSDAPMACISPVNTSEMD